MIFDTKRKAEAQAPAHQTTNTYYIMFEKKTSDVTCCRHSEFSRHSLGSLREPLCSCKHL